MLRALCFEDCQKKKGDERERGREAREGGGGGEEEKGQRGELYVAVKKSCNETLFISSV